MEKYREEIFECLKTIPKGKVTTYKSIALKLGNKNLARVVGNILHTNKDKYEVPCFRVVTSKGYLSENYALGKLSEQKRLLEEDGIDVKDKKIDLNRYFYEV